MASKYDKRKLQDLIRASNGQMDQALGVVVEEMRNEIVESFGTSPAGRTYRRGRKTHTASVEGYPPNVDTGQLRASIRARRMGGLRTLHLKYRIEDGVTWGIYMELGTPSGKIKKRPFVRPVFEAWGQGGKALKRLRELLGKALG